MSREVRPGRALALLLALALTDCGAVPSAPQRAETAPTAEPFVSGTPETSAPQETGGPSAAPQEEETMLYIQIGDATLTAVLEDNPSAQALAELLEDGPVTLEAENYGGFEKTARLPEALPQNDARITAGPGDVMLYQGDTVVLFYGSNTWSYTKLARITETEGLETALSGGETAFTLSLQP